MAIPSLTRLAAAIFVLATAWVRTASAQQPVPEFADDGLTRESLNAAVHPPPAPVAENHRYHRRKILVDPKDAVVVRPLREYYRPARKPSAQMASTPAKRRHRNPVARFVYWWNGMVIRKLHTKFGTVLLGTIGAET